MIIYITVGGANSLASLIDPALLSCGEAGKPEVLITFAGYPKLYDSLPTIIEKAHAHIRNDGLGAAGR